MRMEGSGARAGRRKEVAGVAALQEKPRGVWPLAGEAREREGWSLAEEGEPSRREGSGAWANRPEEKRAWRRPPTGGRETQR